MQKRLYLISLIILCTGLTGSLIILMTASDTSSNAMVQDFENSKRYIHNLELYGGKMNVLMAQFIRWFEGLWQGKNLALSVAVITILVAGVFAAIAYLQPEDKTSGGNRAQPSS